MLESWTLDNFKSVGRKLTLPLSPITVLVGANSCGKSSIIQSILLIKQTLQYATSERPVALNGPLLKLGNFQDVKNVISTDKSFGISWQYSPGSSAEHIPSHSIAEAGIIGARNAYYSRRNITAIGFELQFDADPAAPTSELSLLQPSLLSCSMSVKASDPDSTNHSARLQIRRHDAVGSTDLGKSDFLSGDRKTYPEPIIYNIQHSDSETRTEVLEGYPDARMVGAFLRHFMPYSVVVEFDDAKRRASLLAENICTMRPMVRSRPELSQTVAPQAVIHIIRDWIQSNDDFFSNQGTLFDGIADGRAYRVSDIIEMLYSLRRQHMRRATASFPSLQELQPKIAAAFADSFTSRLLIALERPRLLTDGGAQTRDYFENYVRYLGPLRDEPKPLYPLEALANPTDVGYRGEHTAAVLDINQYRSVSYIPSDSFQENSIQWSTRSVSLVEAVIDWLSYMGIVEGLTTGDRGKIGHELQVKTPGISKYHDLTNVGVGVSQVLPIVVMALLSAPGSLLIFEQPELHLHPRVQTRLGDFFISIASAEKQCLVETHSEYLLYRLRRRIAEAPDDQLTNLSKLYFVERKGGVTSCRQVDVTRYGAITNWPPDFFDQSQDEAEKILMAASAKRAAERNVTEK